MLGGRWEEKVWAGPLPHGYGDAAASWASREAQTCSCVCMETTARTLQTQEGDNKPLGLGPRWTFLSEPPPPARAPGMTLHPGTRVPPVLSPSAAQRALLPSAIPLPKPCRGSHWLWGG